MSDFCCSCCFHQQRSLWISNMSCVLYNFTQFYSFSVPPSFSRTGGTWKVSSYSNDFSLISESLSVNWLITSNLIHLVQRDSSKTNKEMKFISSFPSKYCFSCSSSEAEEKRNKYYFDTAKVQGIWECCWVTGTVKKTKDKRLQSLFLTVCSELHCLLPFLPTPPCLGCRAGRTFSPSLCSSLRAKGQLIKSSACRKQV